MPPTHAPPNWRAVSFASSNDNPPEILVESAAERLLTTTEGGSIPNTDFNSTRPAKGWVGIPNSESSPVSSRTMGGRVGIPNSEFRIPNSLLRPVLSCRRRGSA